MAIKDPLGEILKEANGLQKAGESAGALEILQTALRENPDNVQILLAMGLVYNQLGNYQKAVPVLQRACHIDPQNEAILVPYSRALSGIGNNKDALMLVQASMVSSPDSIEALENAHDICSRADYKKGAIQCLERLCALRPKEKRYYSELTLLYGSSRQFEKATKTFQTFWDETTATADDFAMAGQFTYFAQNAEKAIEYLEKSLAMEPENPHVWTFLGRCYSSLGNNEAAGEAYKKAISGTPPFFGAYYYLSEIVNFAKGSPEFATLEGLKSDETLGNTDIASIGFALGRMYHGIGEFDKAFENYNTGNSALRDHFAQTDKAFNRPDLEKDNSRVTRLFSPENRKKLKYKGSKSNKPVFIIGLPRSGTTLLEQIMSAHSKISTAGELNDLHLIYSEITSPTRALEGPARLAAMMDIINERGDDFAESYLKTLEQKGGASDLVIDKLPQNFSQLGLINVLFPNAKIIHIKRDPLDVGLSIFRTWFTDNLTFARDLCDIGFYICKYRDLMAEWKKTIDLPIFEVEYQALVNEPEAVARGVIEFCGQEWQPECLEYYKNRRSVFTASLTQVREPVYKSAIGKWKNYEKHMGPLKAALAEKG